MAPSLGMIEIRAYMALPRAKVAAVTSPVKRTEFILSEINPKMGEKIMFPKASAATTNPYCSILVSGSSCKGRNG